MRPVAEVTVRTATGADVPVIAELHRVTWRAAYARLLPEAVLDALDDPAASRAWAGAVAGGATVLIANEGTVDVGFCVAAPAPAAEVADADGTAPPDADRTMLVSTLLVEPRWGRRGHGGRLLARVATELIRAGCTRGIAWVPAEDPASLGFYHRAGWEPDRTVRTLDAGGRPLREVRLTGLLQP